MHRLLIGAWVAQTIAAVADVRIADALADGPLSIDDLAGKVGADPDALRRALRAVMSKGISLNATTAATS